MAHIRITMVANLGIWKKLIQFRIPIQNERRCLFFCPHKQKFQGVGCRYGSMQRQVCFCAIMPRQAAVILLENSVKRNETFSWW